MKPKEKNIKNIKNGKYGGKWGIFLNENNKENEK